MEKYLLSFLFLLSTLGNLWAQERTLSGKILSSEDNQPLPGVNIILKGTSVGTTTDIDGNYRLSVPTGDAILVFSVIGYTPQEIVVGTQTTIDLVMKVDVQQLQEVVVTGYGSQIKRELTGAITQVKGEGLRNFPAPTLDAMLQGRGAGIQVNQAGGAPGSPVRVMIRGTSSISAGSEPLWVVDGIPISNDVGGIGGGGRGAIPQNPLATINPNDIESVEVLKDAAATAIYGSRGANGVILVTTKSGRRGSGGINFDYSAGVNDLTRSPEDMNFANSQQWVDLVNLSRTNTGLPADILSNLTPLTAIQAGTDRLTAEQIANTNWFDQILRKGGFQEFNVSSSKAFDKGSMFISGNYRSDKGVLKNNDLDRFTTRVNLEYEPVTGLKMGIRTNLAYTKNQRVMNGGAPSGNEAVAAGGFNAAATGALPILPIYAPTEASRYFNPRSGMNLVATTDRSLYRDEVESYRALGGVYAEYAVPFIKGLSLRTEWSADINHTNRLFWAAADLRPSGLNYSENAINTSRNFNYNGYATYNKAFGADHEVTIVAGTESQRFNGRGANLFGEGIPGRNQDFGSPTATITRAPSAGFGGERYIRAFFGRVNYKFKDRYLLGGSFRRDGVSIFTEENRWSNFSALSAGWILSEEAFLSDIDLLSFLKIRASFGQTGNQNIDSNVTFQGTVDWPRYGGTQGSQVLSRVAVTDVTWETTNSYDAGIDFGFFNNRVTGSIGYYRQDVTDLLFQVPVAPSVGLNFGGNQIWANVADMRNEGFEFELNSVNVDKAGFKWSTSFNLTTNGNEILSINSELDARGNGVVSGMTRNITGRPLSTFFVAEYAGIDPSNGVAMIYEIDRDEFGRTGRTIKTGNVIPASNANLQNHRILQDKTGLPTFFGGLNNTISYKGLELSVLFSFQGGNWIYDQGEVGRTQVGLGNNTLSADLIGNTWQQPGDVTKYPRLMWNTRQNIDNNGNAVYNADGTPNYNQNYGIGGNAAVMDRYLYRGDFIRLRNIQLAYTLPSSMVKKAFLQNARVFVSASNIWTITGYNGWDPEILNFSGSAQARNLEQGVAGNDLPQLITLSGGLNLTF